MSTTVVAQATGKSDADPAFEQFAVITVREDVHPDVVEKATENVSKRDISPEEGVIDEIELRASLASELKAEGLTLERLEIVGWVWFGE